MTKTDNGNLVAKLDLRRYFLSKYHQALPDVLDCCQGNSVIWNVLRNEFKVRTYWGVDLKPKKGRLKIDSKRILEQPGWPQTIIDIDTYGFPWKHWMAMLPNISQPVTVFLTIGQVSMARDQEVLNSLGLQHLDLPPGIAVKLQKMPLRYILCRCFDFNIMIREAVEATSQGNARYVGVRLEPITSEQLNKTKRLTQTF